jgi:TMEM175 potassium channel family protein
VTCPKGSRNGFRELKFSSRPTPGDHGGMSEPYNRFSGRSVERITALSDGLFAVAMTLLVLDLRVPVAAAGHTYSEHGLGEALLKLGPGFVAYLLSFTMLGTFWLAQHTLLGIFGRCDRTLTWINLMFLFVVSLLPFSTGLLAHNVHVRIAVGVYWLNILLLGTGLEWAARYGRRAFVPDRTGQAHTRLVTFRRRILLAQTLYALAALMCFISTLASVAALVAVQLYFILSPRLRPLRKTAA